MQQLTQQTSRTSILLLACGALAKEVVTLISHNHLQHIDVQCLPAHLHHRPVLIPEAIRKAIEKYRHRYSKIFVIYGDCGTAGALDEVLEEYGIERIPGPHCFSFFEGNERFASNEEDVTSFFLTDFFCRHFDKFMWQQYGLDKSPSMLSFMFGNYKKLVYVAQTRDRKLTEKAREIARRLGLDFEYRYRGYSDLEIFIKNIDE